MPDAFDVDLERRDREPDHALELVVHAGTHRFCDLGELHSVLDDDAQFDREPVRPEIDVDALLDPPRDEPREPSAPCECDDAVALRSGGTDNLRDGVRRDGDASPLGGRDHEGLPLHGGETTTAARRSDCFLNLAGLEAARADVSAGRVAVEHDPNALEVRVEASLGGDHGVASAVAEAGLLATDCADLAHERVRMVPTTRRAPLARSAR